jgi:hypothetical protein
MTFCNLFAGNLVMIFRTLFSRAYVSLRRYPYYGSPIEILICAQASIKQSNWSYVEEITILNPILLFRLGPMSHI